MHKHIVAGLLLILACAPRSAAAQTSPIRRVAQVTIVVRDQDEALAFYVDKLGFEKREDTRLGAFRWLTVAPPGQTDLAIVLEKPSGDMGEAREKQLTMLVGQSPTWVFDTADCNAAYETLKSRGVEFVTAPKKMPYGTEAVFRDLYGNTFALTQHR